MLSPKKTSNTRIDHQKNSDDPSAGSIVPGQMLAQVKVFAQGCFDKASGSHDWDHTLRVFRLCEVLGPAENADMVVLGAAAYLHDIGRALQDASNGAVCHAEKGAQMAEPMVEGLLLSKKQKHNIIHCIRSHRFRNDHKPATTEAKVLFDADKLDAIGAVGVARAFLFAGEVGARLGYREFKVKLCKIKDRMLTAEGRKWASERHAFMADFFNRFLAEYEGKR
jgi:uncharacterized protein